MATVIKIQPPSIQDQRAELRELVEAVRARARSAERAAEQGDEQRVSKELDRMRRMLARWEGLRDGSDLDARMLFVDGIRFFAEVAQSRRGPMDFAGAAEALAAKMKRLDPAGARRIDTKAVAEAIELKARGRWPWKQIAAAWGRGDIPPETWRTEWARWSKP